MVSLGLTIQVCTEASSSQMHRGSFNLSQISTSHCLLQSVAMMTSKIIGWGWCDFQCIAMMAQLSHLVVCQRVWGSSHAWSWGGFPGGAFICFWIFAHVDNVHWLWLWGVRMFELFLLNGLIVAFYLFLFWSYLSPSWIVDRWCLMITHWE